MLVRWKLSRMLDTEQSGLGSFIINFAFWAILASLAVPAYLNFVIPGIFGILIGFHVRKAQPEMTIHGIIALGAMYVIVFKSLNVNPWVIVLGTPLLWPYALYVGRWNLSLKNKVTPPKLPIQKEKDHIELQNNETRNSSSASLGLDSQLSVDIVGSSSLPGTSKMHSLKSNFENRKSHPRSWRFSKYENGSLLDLPFPGQGLLHHLHGSMRITQFACKIFRNLLKSLLGLLICFRGNHTSYRTFSK